MRNTIVKRAIFILIFALIILFVGELRSEALTFQKQWGDSEISRDGTVQAILESRETEEGDVWNIAKDGSDSLIAKYSENNGRGILEIKVKEGIEGPVEMKDWNLNNQDMPRWVQAPYSELIRQINFSGSISNIGDYAFFDLKNVKTIAIPYGVEHIGFGNFNNCDSLETLLLPPSLRVLDNMEIYYVGTGLTVKGFRGTPAENIRGSKNVRITFYDKTITWDLSVDKNESVIGCLDYVSGTLTISGNGVMADFGDGADRAPWINRMILGIYIRI